MIHDEFSFQIRNDQFQSIGYRINELHAKNQSRLPQAFGPLENDDDSEKRDYV
jgi:hypothetical protein